MNSDSFSDADLPEDVHRWPTDPSKLFGLSPESTRRDLKLAYVRLIRRFKPERFPDQFRLLREAFEQHDRRLEWLERISGQESNRDRGPVPPDAAPVTVAGPSAQSSEQSSAGSSEQSRPNDREPLRSGDVTVTDDQLWQQALDGGDLHAIYRQIRDLAVRERATDVLFARLYWLLTVCPSLDRDRDPVEWLEQGIRRLGYQNRLPSILSVDVRQRRGDVPAALTAGWIAYDAPLTSDLILARWYVARSLGRFGLIAFDLRDVRLRYLDKPEQWLQLLFAAVRQVVMSRDETARELLAAIHDEVQNVAATPDANWLWDWYESTTALHQAWLAGSQAVLVTDINLIQFTTLDSRSAVMQNSRADHTRQTIDRLGKLIESTWECSTVQARGDVIAFCSQLLEQPRGGFHKLAAIAQVQRPLVRRLLELLGEQIEDFVDEEAYALTSAVEERLREFVCERMWADAYWLITAFDFCLNEAVTPQQIADAIERCPSPICESHLHIADLLRTNLPLSCAVQASRLLN